MKIIVLFHEEFLEEFWLFPETVEAQYIAPLLTFKNQ